MDFSFKNIYLAIINLLKFIFKAIKSISSTNLMQKYLNFILYFSDNKHIINKTFSIITKIIEIIETINPILFNSIDVSNRLNYIKDLTVIKYVTKGKIP